MRWVRAAVLLVLTTGAVMAAEVAYLGIADGAAPAFEEEFDGLLRKAILSESGLALVDDQTVHSIRHRVNFGNHPAVSRTLVRKLLGFVSDTTILVWGRISDYTIRPRRKHLVRTYVEGTVTVSLTIYSIHYQKYAYGGEVSARAEIPKGWIFFDRVDKVVHVSAHDRATVMERLQKVAARRTASLITAVVGSEAMRIEEIEGVQGQRYEEPSVSDLFGLPSVEGEPVDDVETEPEVEGESEQEEEAAGESEAQPEESTEENEAEEEAPRQEESSAEDQTAEPQSE